MYVQENRGPPLIIIVIAAGWWVGSYTTPSASQDDGTNFTLKPELNQQPAVSAGKTDAPQPSPEPSPSVKPALSPKPSASSPGAGEKAAGGKTSTEPSPARTASTPAEASGSKAVLAAAEPDSVTVMVNKQYKLPENYKPADLVYPNVPFLFKEKLEKRMMRSAAAKALEKMFAGAKKEGVYLAGVSAFRSQSTQETLFKRYVERDGAEKARTYSAVPGHSEHQTGLAVDISGKDGKCAAESCFAGTKEAEWLKRHAAEYGFIIRYPEGKESVTGYMYEPWHVRYVGTDMARAIAEKGITLEEYLDAVPVSR